MLGRRSLIALAPSLLIGRQARADAPVQDMDWSDRRMLQVRVRWPAPGTPGPWTVLLHSHGLGGSRLGGEAWGSAWAAAGCVVVHLQHAGSDLQAVRRSGLAGAMGAAQLVDRLRDVQQALDTVQRLHAARDGAWSQVRPDTMGLSGHSFGAHTVLAMAGQRFPMLDPMDEPRLAAFIALSPTLPRGDVRLAYAGLRRPVLVCTGSEDGDVVGTGATPATRRAVFDALPEGRKALLWLEGADHMSFGGGTGGAGERWLRRAGGAREREAQHRAVIQTITADWWRAWLRDDAAARELLRQPHGLAQGDVWVTG